MQGSNQLDTRLLLPAWAMKLQMNPEEFYEWAKTYQHKSPNKTHETICEACEQFSVKYQIDFLTTVVYALDLCDLAAITPEKVEDHLHKTLKPAIIENSNQHISRDSKTIVLVGRSSEGKSTLTNHLIEEDVAKVGHSHSSQTMGAHLYMSTKNRLNIIDTEGLDGTSQKEDNQQLMLKIVNKILLCLEDAASIDAIVVMWCPLKNGKSGLMKTIETLKIALGESVIQSCIVMIQGNWLPLAEILELKKPVEEATNEMKSKYPQIPIINYDAKGPIAQLPILLSAIQKVEPYKKDYFKELRRRQYLEMLSAYTHQKHKFEQKRLQELAEARGGPSLSESEYQKQVEQLQAEAQKLRSETQRKLNEINQERQERAKQKVKTFGNTLEDSAVRNCGLFTLGTLGGAAGIVIESELLLAAGLATTTLGVVGLAVTGVAAGGYGIYKAGSWLYEKLFD